MAGKQSGNPMRRAVRAVTTKDWGAKAKSVAAALKAEHAAGLRGDDSPAQPVWPTPREQLEAVRRLFKASPAQPAAAGAEVHPDADDRDAVDRDADQVAEALRRVDWGDVRAAAAERTSDVTRTMKEMAAHVDWARIQPVAAQVSSALIAAVASGRIPLGGQLGPVVARAITDQNNMGTRVADNLRRTKTIVPTDFGRIIDTTARDA